MKSWICYGVLLGATLLGVTYLGIVRARLRQKLGIAPCCCPDSQSTFLRYLGDWCIMLWCMKCALCQVSAGAR
jgi:hypothetical protein